MSRKSAFKLAVVGGAGRLGLPLSLAFAERGVATLICDVNEAALETLGRGRMPFREKGGARILASAIRAGTIRLASDPGKLRGIKSVILAVPASPESALEKCIDQITPYLSRGSLLMICSTLPVGATPHAAYERIDFRGKPVFQVGAEFKSRSRSPARARPREPRRSALQ